MGILSDITDKTIKMISQLFVNKSRHIKLSSKESSLNNASFALYFITSVFDNSNSDSDKKIYASIYKFVITALIIDSWSFKKKNLKYACVLYLCFYKVAYKTKSNEIRAPSYTEISNVPV